MTAATPDRRGGTRPLVSVIGLGYLGATHAICMASIGFDVVALDVDASKVERLQRGEVPFHEPGLTDLLGRVLAGDDGAGRLTFTTSFEGVADADLHFLCVGTPQRVDGPGADMQYVDAAVSALSAQLRRPTVVVGKSTVPVGTAIRLAGLIGTEAPAGEDVTLIWNPEFLREGFAVEDTLRPDRVVFGVPDGRTLPEVVTTVYAPILERGTPMILTDYATAELVKASANAFLATKISFINAIAEICEATGADVTSLAEAIGHDNRIGHRFLRAGVGFGGGCLPKDIRAFSARAEELGLSESLAFLDEVDKINLRRRAFVVELLEKEMGGLSGRHITIWGAAFKPDSDDIRDSPALDIARLVADRGATVSLYDPAAMPNARRIAPQLGYAESLTASVEGADAIALLTEWQEFRDADPAALASRVRRRVVVDGRNVLDGERWLDAGFTYLPLGRPALRPA